MICRELGKTGQKISAFALGGHEFYSNGGIRGFSDDGKLSVTRGHVFDGFGGENRRAIVHRALDLGINLFDVTMDSEKDAMGKILSDFAPSEDILIQTRPEGMVYSYDPENRQMAQYDLLEKEVARICGLLHRDHVDILNFAFMREALDADSDYLEKIGHNIARLKQKGLIRYASADTFSGESTYIEQFHSGHFDTTFINYNPLDEAMDDKVIPEAANQRIAILTRESFKKGRVFELAETAGVTDRSLVARCILKWILSNQHLTSTVIGVASPEQLDENCAVLESPELDQEEIETLETIRTSPAFAEATRIVRQGIKR
jgi:aryl-alcohol dehydrogenase-like predicted oxidoreductase